MNSSSKLRYAVLQPLLGGMYLGAEAVIGHPAECIISFDGLDAVRRDENGNITEALNEYHLTSYLKKHNRMVPYYTFKDQKMFDNKEVNESQLVDHYTNSLVYPDFSNIDLVVAVPVCSGLSTVTSCDDSVREIRNNNMLFLSRYALSVIKPKVYIFENAPTFMGSRGNYIRKILEDLASTTGYKIVYYKTDTSLHDNCQKRPRTFIYFFKGDKVPKIEFDKRTCSVEEFLNRIPDDATQKVNFRLKNNISVPVKYMNYLYGSHWRDFVGNDIFSSVVKSDEEISKFLSWAEEYCSESDYKKFKSYIDHIKDKKSSGKGFWCITPRVYKDSMPACMYKNIFNLLHYKEDRLYNCREWLSIMGMPYDFELQGDYLRNAKKIGQNVPVGTAAFVVKQAVNYLNNNIEFIDTKSNIFIDNINQTISEV